MLFVVDIGAMGFLGYAIRITEY